MRQSITGDYGHIIGRGIVTFGGQTIGVDKMGILQAQFIYSGIHLIYKILEGPFQKLGQGNTGIISRTCGYSDHHLFIRHRLAWFQIDLRSSHFPGILAGYNLVAKVCFPFLQGFYAQCQSH
ncbi:hypothetical protein SDC9_184958 [bioreactor metagenome]|uniref:Uncharacterized protein n=1 Tax=bioreactor metagenome TaxID=1076179 RepID=A0A645HFC4_9ZZZZ